MIFETTVLTLVAAAASSGPNQEACCSELRA